jgi:hypothetical protein
MAVDLEVVWLWLAAMYLVAILKRIETFGQIYFHLQVQNVNKSLKGLHE